MASPAALLGSVSRLAPLTLDDVLATAELQTRTDRKYVVPMSLLEAVLDELAGDLQVLEIDDRRVFRYESVYFDTPGLTAYHQHAHGRRRRVKIRTRAYLDSGQCLLEFKSVGSRGQTVKERHPVPLSSRHRLEAPALALARDSVGHCIATDELGSVLTIGYRRATLVDAVRGARVTCDVALEFRDSVGRCVGPMADLVVLESKTAGPEAPIDRTLRRLARRPVALSKYCVGMAVLDPRLPANRWNRELRTFFGWSPRGR